MQRFFGYILTPVIFDLRLMIYAHPNVGFNKRLQLFYSGRIPFSYMCRRRCGIELGVAIGIRRN